MGVFTLIIVIRNDTIRIKRLALPTLEKSKHSLKGYLYVVA